MRLFSWYFKSNLLLRIMLGLILGAVAGLMLGEEISWVSPFGDIFVRLLKMIVMPVVMFTLIVGAASVHPARLGRVGVKALGIYMVTTGFAVGLGLLLGNLFKPGKGLDLSGAGGDVAKSTLETPSLVDTIVNIVPVNPFNAITSGDILPTIFFCLMFGIGIAFLRESEDERIKNAAVTVFHFFEGGAEIMYLVVNWILQYAPIGVFALIAVVFGTQGAEAFGPLGLTTLAVYLGFAAHMFLVYGAGLAIFGLSPFKFFVKAKKAIITGFVTRSSGGTLPVSMEVADEEMGVSKGGVLFLFTSGSNH